ncbi:MAG TPA: COX15/CtaA family protein [Anaerolineales bacterium]|nr:COX15/CtaA family protein [Anaerolineales bacterium]
MKLSHFAKYAWGVLAFNIAVILWGTYVRATGSGGGCGGHWPLCNGQVIPRAPAVETLIEISHRGSVGIAFALVSVMLVWAFRAYPKKHPVRTGAALSMAFFISESLVGAALVLLELVAHNASLTRAFSTSAHLVNTFILVACMTLTAWWASGGKPLRLRDGAALPLGIGALAMMVLGMSGAVAALGDALFPAASLAEGLAQDSSPTAHVFIQLRIYHPFIGVGVGLTLMVLAGMYGISDRNLTTKWLAAVLIVLVMTQWIAGILNVLLLAPIWMQIVHLFLADAVWITFVLMAARVLTRGAESAGVTGELATARAK